MFLSQKNPRFLFRDLLLVSLSLYRVDVNIIIPKHFFIPINTAPQALLDEIYTYGKPYSVKYSLYGKKAFSYDRKRGANSSRGRRLDVPSLSRLQTLEKIRQFIEQAPNKCAGLILQEFINQKGGCLLHGEFSVEGAEVELLWEGSAGRAYSFFPLYDDNLVAYEEIEGEGEPLNRKNACTEIAKKLQVSYNKLLMKYGDISWSLEGFWFPDRAKLTILQLRPTPQDRPISPIRNTNHNIYSTYFTWGNYEVGPFEIKKSTEDINYEEVFIRKKFSQDEMEPEVKERLSLGKFVLLSRP